MAKVTEGKLVTVDYGTIKIKETIAGKTVVDSENEYALITLDTGDTFHLSGKSGHELQTAGLGRKLKITQDKGTITVETV